MKRDGSLANLRLKIAGMPLMFLVVQVEPGRTLMDDDETITREIVSTSPIGWLG